MQRTPDPADARAKRIVIAESGARATAIADRFIAEVEAEWSTHLGVFRMDQLRPALALMCEIPDPGPDRP